MSNTTPNKEIVRRICLLHGATKCHLLVETGDDPIGVLADINDQKILSCINELESWAGMKFRVYNYNSNKTIDDFLKKSEQILPIKF